MTLQNGGQKRFLSNKTWIITKVRSFTILCSNLTDKNIENIGKMKLKTRSPNKNSLIFTNFWVMFSVFEDDDFNLNKLTLNLQFKLHDE